MGSKWLFVYRYWLTLALAAFTGTPAMAAASSPTGAPSGNSSSLSITHSTVTPTELKTLLREFQRAQKGELQALEHQQDLEKRELRASQNARFKEWKKKEKDERHKLIQQHMPFDQLNPKFKDYVRRMKALQKIFEDERTQQLREHDARLNAIKHDQVTRLREFQDAIQRGDRPPQRLWPESHR